MIQVVLVPSHDVIAAWPYCQSFIQQGMNIVTQVYGINELLTELIAGRYQLWVVVDEQEVIGAVVTFIEQGTKAKVLSVPHLGGERFKDWVHLMDSNLTAFGRQNGCVAYEAVMRRGFGRMVDGLEEIAAYCVKRIDGGLSG